MFKLCCHGDIVHSGVIVVLGFGWRDVSDKLEKAPVVELERQIVKVSRN